MSKKIYNLIILDESGSMMSIKDVTINGFNETVQTIQSAQKENEDQEHYVTLVSFNSSKIKTIYERVEAGKVDKLDKYSYLPDDYTPLYDAIGKSVSNLRKFLADKSDYIVLVTIITDGEENASIEYNSNSIRDLINDLKKEEWVFTYVGANHDVYRVAQSISINNTLVFESDVKGTQEMNVKYEEYRKKAYRKMSNGVTANFLNMNFFEDDEL